MAKPTTVRLSALVGEHVLPMVLDLVYFVVLYAVLVLGFGLRDTGGSTFLILLSVVLVHVIQLRWFVAVRFDDDGLTIIRPWSRRRVEWSQIGGLIYTQDRSTQARGALKLRLVLKGDEPPFGRYLTQSQIALHARGPVVMTPTNLDSDPTAPTRSGRCQYQVYTELARHGFPKPPPQRLVFRSSEYTPEEASRAAAADLLAQRDELDPGRRLPGSFTDDPRDPPADQAGSAEQKPPIRWESEPDQP
ncbi:MAG TPA: hypothetical protein VHW44_02380 [Pseudonocardiaceae bacterium]|jgi:hypothetical protein|nr:hypothetical protein [Pseudonocardiaceae bacterium]